MPETKYRTCNLCEALCGLEVIVDNNEVVSIKGDKLDVFSRGHICPKALALKDLHEDPDRLKLPMQKVDGEWKQINWEDAYRVVAEKLVDIQVKHGDNAIGIYQGNPSVHNLGTSLFSPDFVRATKTKNRYSATSVDQLAHHLAAEHMFGHGLQIPVPDIDRTSFWLIMGGNPLVSNGSMMTAPNVAGKLRAIQKRGGKVVVIDPRRTETADKADQHLFIKPATDIWLLLGLINYIFQNELVNLGHLSSRINQEQLAQIKEAVLPFTIEFAAKHTSIDREDIVQLAKDLVNADSAVFYGRLGVSATFHGGLCHWAINTLNILTGNFDKEGGAMFTTPAVNLVKKRKPQPKFNRWQSRISGRPEYGGELPSSTMAEDILTEGEGQIKAMITSCGNPVLSVPNGQKLDDAFDSLEFMVSIDIYLNETTRHADVILPPATGLETPHYGMAFHNLAVHNTAKYSEPSVAKEDGARYDWEIFSNLTASYLAERQRQLNEPDSDRPNFSLEEKLNLLLNFGPHKLSLEKLKQYPHGIDLGPLETKWDGTENHIDILPAIYQKAIKNLKPEQSPERDLLLIGRRDLRSNNSWLHNAHRMVKGPERCTVLVHPADAESYNITDGDLVTVTSDISSVSIRAKVSDEIMEGCISIPHGWGHHRDGTKMKVAEQHAGVSLNDLIDESLTDELSGVSVINGIPVSISNTIA